MVRIRDRIIELRRVRAGDLAPNPGQWRTHGDSQRRALEGVLAEVGFAGAALAYQDDQGQLVLVDGHLRSSLDPNAIIPVLVTDLDAEEARKLLAVYDPLSAMAGYDQDALLSLLETVQFQDQAVMDLLQQMGDEEGESWLRDSQDHPERETGDPRKRVNAVLYMDEVALFEAALLATGERNRGEALLIIMRGYLEQKP